MSCDFQHKSWSFFTSIRFVTLFSSKSGIWECKYIITPSTVTPGSNCVTYTAFDSFGLTSTAGTEEFWCLRFVIVTSWPRCCDVISFVPEINGQLLNLLATAMFLAAGLLAVDDVWRTDFTDGDETDDFDMDANEAPKVCFFSNVSSINDGFCDRDPQYFSSVIHRFGFYLTKLCRALNQRKLSTKQTTKHNVLTVYRLTREVDHLTLAFLLHRKSLVMTKSGRRTVRTACLSTFGVSTPFRLGEFSHDWKQSLHKKTMFGMTNNFDAG